ncbi:MAG TPA: DinB family protein [Nocardioidaceae bacterium]|nr:DinB family protein [Nocardioidaceae bacterium]
MTGAELLVEAFGRIRESVHQVADGLSPEQLAFAVRPGANTIGWLLWHLARVQDDHIAEVAGTDQVWDTDGWADRFGLPFDTAATGFGQSPDEVAAVRVEADQLTGYYDAVHARTLDYVTALSDKDFDRVVDERWDPPVTLGVRLVSVVNDDTQHVGQAAFVRGVLA